MIRVSIPYDRTVKSRNASQIYLDGRESPGVHAFSLPRPHGSQALPVQIALCHVGHFRPRVINVDGHPTYPAVVTELKQRGELSKVCRCRPSPYMNNIIEQDHRFIKKRIVASQWFRSIHGAVNTIQGYEAMHMIRKGRSGGYLRAISQVRSDL